MFWNDIEKIKDTLCRLTERIAQIEEQREEMAGLEKGFEDFKESVDTFLFSEDSYSPINRIHDKLDRLITDERRIQQVVLAEKTLDKFEDYMKNIDKLNTMINEFKGCVSLARAAVAERKQSD